MAWLLIDSTNHQIVSGPHADEPSAEGAYAVMVAIGWPEAVAWVPERQGFVDVAPPVTTMSRLAFQKLFTQAERIAIRASADPAVIDFRELALLAEFIDLADGDVATGTHYLETLALIDEGRAAQVLAGQTPTAL